MPVSGLPPFHCGFRCGLASQPLIKQTIEATGVERHLKTRQIVITRHRTGHELSLETFDDLQTWREDMAAFLPYTCTLVYMDSKNSRCVWKDSAFVEADWMPRICQHVAPLVEARCGQVPAEVLDWEAIELLHESLASHTSPEIARNRPTRGSTTA